MDWLRGKAQRPKPPTEERPSSKGSARDLADIVAGVELEGNAAVHGGDEVEAWRDDNTADQHKPAEIHGDEDEDEDDDSVHAPTKDVDKEILVSRLFDAIDKDGGGALCKEELTPALEAIGYDKAGAALIFDSIDQDGSNEISREEFLDFFGQPQNGELFRKLRYAGIKTKVPKNVSVMKTGCAGPARASSTNMAMLEVWEQHDADRDGWLNEQQLYDALKSVGIRLRKKEKHELRRELEDELELWSDSNDSQMPSDASVASDIDAEETVYEDHLNIVRVLQNIPRDSIERLVVNERGKTEWKPVLLGQDRLDRDKPEQIANWVSATCTPGSSLKETREEIIAKTFFLKMVCQHQTKHETNAFKTERVRFQRAWMDRSLERSALEENFRQWLKDIRTSAYWKGLVQSLFSRVRKRVLEELEIDQEVLTRGRRSLKATSIEIKPRNVLERVNQMFIDELGHMNDEERHSRYINAFEDVCKREETESLGVRAVIRAMRTFGCSLNSAEVFEMMEEMTGQELINEDVCIDVHDFCDLCETLFHAVIEAGGKDKLVVFIQEAGDLPVMDRFGAADPFVTVEVVGRPDEDRKRTATRKGSLNPAWRHEMTIFDVSVNDVLMVSMWDDEDSGFGATLIGEFILSLRDVQESGEMVNTTTHAVERWFELVDDNGKVIMGKFGGASKIQARISYVRGSLTELKQKPLGPQNMEFSLITIKIKSAEHLPKMDKGDSGSVDPYCIISYNDHRIRTCTVIQNYNPVWDEEFVLSVDCAEGEIIVTLFDYDEDGRDDVIGSCKVFVSLLTDETAEQTYELRTPEENSLVLGSDGERAALRIEASIVLNEQMQETMSTMEIGFEGMASDHHGTVLACCSALWQMLQNDEDRCERDSLHILNRWQTMADVLLTGVLEINVHSATDLPRMDYFGLCDPYVTITLDGVEVKTETKKTTLDPVWDQTLRMPTFLAALKPSAPISEKPTILVRVYDWDKVGEHDLVGSVLIPFEDWISRGPEKVEWDIVGEPEKVRSLRPGEPDQVVRKPIIGHSGRQSKLQMTVDYTRRVVVMDECMEEIAWAIVFAVLEHQENAENFGYTLGGIGGLVSLLRKPIPDGTNGEALQAACYALGNLAAAHRPNQNLIMQNLGIERLLDLITVKMPSAVQRAACLAVSAVVCDNPQCISRVLNYHKKDPEVEELIQRAGGIGTMLVLLRDARPDPNFKARKGKDEDAWTVVAEVYEACLKAIATSSFMNLRGLWFINATSFFSKADQRATAREVAVAMGRPGLTILQQISMLPPDNKRSREMGLKRATKETLRYANLSYQALDAAYGAG